MAPSFLSSCFLNTWAPVSSPLSPGSGPSFLSTQCCQLPSPQFTMLPVLSPQHIVLPVLSRQYSILSLTMFPLPSTQDPQYSVLNSQCSQYSAPRTQCSIFSKQCSQYSVLSTILTVSHNLQCSMLSITSHLSLQCVPAPTPSGPRRAPP